MPRPGAGLLKSNPPEVVIKGPVDRPRAHLRHRHTRLSLRLTPPVGVRFRQHLARLGAKRAVLAHNTRDPVARLGDGAAPAPRLLLALELPFQPVMDAGRAATTAMAYLSWRQCACPGRRQRYSRWRVADRGLSALCRRLPQLPAGARANLRHCRSALRDARRSHQCLDRGEPDDGLARCLQAEASLALALVTDP